MQEAWGKLHAGRPLPLSAHCLDVASVFSALLDLPNLARWAPTDPIHRERLAVLAFLHDYGKCNAGFQAKAEPNARATAGHTFEAMALLCDGQVLWPPEWTRLLAELAAWFRDEEQAVQMLIATLSHHGRPLSRNDYAFSRASDHVER